AMIDTCVKEDVDFDTYASTLALQLAIIDAMDEYRTERRAAGENQSTIMVAVAGSAAVAIASLTHDEPMPGGDVAAMVANDVVYTFANFLAPRMAWIEPPAPPKQPTFGGNTTRN
ncbi:MAG: hypothetical protein ACXWNL_16090, partial [Vulcanimicrobiaceae bacterium]